MEQKSRPLSPRFDALGNKGAEMIGELSVTPDGKFIFKESYLGRTYRQRVGAEAGQTYEAGLVVMTVRPFVEGDL